MLLHLHRFSNEFVVIVLLIVEKTHVLAKNLLQCTLACGQCKGTTCVNSQSVDEVSDIDD